MSISPVMSFGIMVASAVGLLGHLILGGDGRRLIAYLLSAWLGFALGQVIGTIMGLDVLAIGTIRLLPALLGAIIAVLTSALLSTRRGTRRTR